MDTRTISVSVNHVRHAFTVVAWGAGFTTPRTPVRTGPTHLDLLLGLPARPDGHLRPAVAALGGPHHAPRRTASRAPELATASPVTGVARKRRGTGRRRHPAAGRRTAAVVRG